MDQEFLRVTLLALLWSAVGVVCLYRCLKVTPGDTEFLVKGYNEDRAE
jgi:hypothetical protein